MPNRCILCKNQLETVSHLFLHCPFSREVWDSLTRDLGISWCIPKKILNFYTQWINLTKSTDAKNFGAWLLPHFCWGIWKERNNRIFREKKDPTAVVERKIHKLLKENYQVSKGNDIANEENTRKQAKDTQTKR